MDRVIQIYAKNSQDMNMDVYRVHQVSQCIADDEFVTRTGFEPEQIETFLSINKMMVNDLRNERSGSYDYLQKNSQSNEDESQRSGSFLGDGLDHLSAQTGGDEHHQNDVSFAVRNSSVIVG